MVDWAPSQAKTSGAVLTRHWAAALAVAVYFVVMMSYGATTILQYPDERHYAYAAAYMVETGDWLIPVTPEGEVRLKKPILPYWFGAAGFELFGINPFGFRFFWVLGAAAILALTYALALVLGAPRPAALFALALTAGNPFFIRATVNSIPDIPLTVFLMLATLGFVRIFTSDGQAVPRWAPWAGWIGIALAVQAKGLLPVLLVGIVLVHASFFDRSRLRHVLSPLPILAALAIVLSWFALVAWTYPNEFTREFFGDQVTEKVSISPWRWLIALAGYSGVCIGSFLAFFPFLGLLRRRGEQSRPRPVVLMLMVWSLAVPVLFSFAGFVDPRYLMPILPVIAVLLALGLSAVEPERFARYSNRGIIAVAAVLTLVVALGMAVEAQLSSLAGGLLLGLFGLALIAGYLLSACRRAETVPHLLAIGPLLLVILLYPPLRLIAQPDLGRPIAERIASSGIAADRVFFIGTYLEAMTTRLHLGRADPFRQVEELPSDLTSPCLVATSDRALISDLRIRGYPIDIVNGPWRWRGPDEFFSALFSGTLATALPANAEKAAIVRCP
ncbi:ArnT family glycosyltransferase [Flaviflagellibacter deserti]|uniref:ArnT family glycosyltransferase n=1 Tax=Flaviflagellibacter deserti TaxID=2267266 RepID=A0ABV9YX45_9HYPH